MPKVPILNFCCIHFRTWLAFDKRQHCMPRETKHHFSLSLFQAFWPRKNFSDLLQSACTCDKGESCTVCFILGWPWRVLVPSERVLNKAKKSAKQQRPDVLFVFVCWHRGEATELKGWRSRRRRTSYSAQLLTAAGRCKKAEILIAMLTTKWKRL